jgi:hypothetical protein
VIGNAFQKIYDFIASIFKGLFSLLILILAHFYKRAKFYVLALIVGLAIGYFLDKSAQKVYGANMFIQTNLGSSYQVYENIRNLNELAGVENDSLKLASVFNISVADAAKFRGFYIKPSVDINTKIEMFSVFYNSLDSVTRSITTFADYEKNLDHHSFINHQIGVVATDKDVFKKLNSNFPKVISENDYLNSLLIVNQENYVNNEKSLLRQETKIDSLVNIYLTIRNKEANKQPLPGSGTVFNMSGTKDNKLLVDESALISKKLEIASQIRKIKSEKAENLNIISVLSAFPSSGYDVSNWYEKNTVVFGVLFLTITLMIFVFLGLGNYLKKQDAI